MTAKTPVLDVIGPGAMGLHIALSLPADVRVRLRHPEFTPHPDRPVYDADTGAVRNVELLPLNDPSPIELAICTTKSYQVTSALNTLRICWAPQAELLLLTNGLGPQDKASEYLPPDARLWVGVTTEGALRVDAFARRHTGQGETVLGPWNGHHAPGRLAALLAQSTLKGRWLADSTEVRVRVWRKLIVNCAINPLTAELGVRNGTLARPDLMMQWQELVNEAVRVAQAEGLALVSAELHDQVRQVISATAQNYSSMQQDVMHHRPTEANDILGTLVRRAAHHHLVVPQISRLWRTFQDRSA